MEHSKEEIDRAMERVQKLLMLGKEGKGASEAEADSAMRVAQTIMAKFNLDMAEVEAAQSAANQPTEVERVKRGISGRARFKWQRQLAKYVAEANFCYHLIRSEWQDGKRIPQHIFVGRRANVITAQLMYQYLTQAVEDNLPIDDYRQRLSRAANSWKEGCADRLCERLAQKRKDLIAEHDAKVQGVRDAINRKAEAKHKKEPRQIEGNREVEVGSRIDDIAADAYDATGAKQSEEVDRPDVDPKDTWNPADSVDDSAPETSTAMVLASVYDEAEREANWEVAHGLPVGHLAKRRAAAEESARKRAEEEAKSEVEKIEAPVKEETARQRAARERRALNELMKNRRRWAREDETEERRAQRAYEKRDHLMYAKGSDAGKSIGLDTQTGDGGKSERKLLK